MKVTIEEKSEEIKFPCLMEAPSGQVVLFVSATHGTRLAPGANHPDKPIGECSSAWVSVYTSNYWKPFNGKIILENSSE